MLWWSGVEYKKSVLSIWKIGPLAVMWSIWKLRNECLFNEGQPDFEEPKELVRVRIALWAKFNSKG